MSMGESGDFVNNKTQVFIMLYVSNYSIE